MTSRTLLRLCGGMASLVLVAAIIYAGWIRADRNQWPWQHLPGQVHACGRTFGHTGGATGAGPFSQAYVARDGAVAADSWWTLRGEYQLWAAPGCGTGVFVRTPQGEFFGYDLLGGP